MRSRPLTVGTAGHIDHGKTALVKALTGKQTDRLPEERRRGISIELGYAQLKLENRVLSLIDVPGHERLVKTMIAGATGIDLFMLVVDAREGVMPQTEEHVLVLRSLGVVDGVCAITKCDMAEPAEIETTIDEAKRLLPGNVPVVQTSATTGAGIGELRAALRRATEKVESGRLADEPHQPAALHVDRVFTVKGHGTVVTGTLWSGRLRESQKVVIEPGSRVARVRTIEVHDRPVKVAEPRQRVALNIAGLRHDQVSRGDLITDTSSDVAATYRVNVTLTPKSLANDLDGERVQVHHGTRDTPARVIDLEDHGLVQLRLDTQLLVREGDHIVLRTVSDQRTLGGGQVEDQSPARYGANSRKNKQPANDDPVERDHPLPAAAKGANEIPASPPDPATSRVLRLVAEAGLRPVRIEEIAKRLTIDTDRVTGIFDQASASGKIVMLNDGLFIDSGGLAEAIDQIVERGVETGSIRLADVRDLLGIGRRPTQLILEHCDGQRITYRRGDLRYLRRARR